MNAKHARAVEAFDKAKGKTYVRSRVAGACHHVVDEIVVPGFPRPIPVECQAPCFGAVETRRGTSVLVTQTCSKNPKHQPNRAGFAAAPLSKDDLADPRQGWVEVTA